MPAIREADSFLGITIPSRVVGIFQPQCTIIGHLDGDTIDITIGEVTTKLNKEDYGKFMKVAKEIEERMDIKKMENLL